MYDSQEYIGCNDVPSIVRSNIRMVLDESTAPRGVFHITYQLLGDQKRLLGNRSRMHLFCDKGICVAAILALTENLRLISLPNDAGIVHVLIWKIKCNFALIWRYYMLGACHALVLICIKMHVFLSKSRRN